jgi:ATP-binding cassette, subfamily B (MDR/TAP), member 1
VIAALALGLMSFSMLASHALGFWYGSNCVEGNNHCPGANYTPGQVLVVFFSVIMAALNLSQLSPAIKKIAEGKAAAARIFEVIDRDPLVKNA